MKTKLHLTLRTAHLALLVLLSTLNLQLSNLFAQGTAFTYQGRLNDGGTPAHGVYDLEFRVFDNVSSGSQQGGTVTVGDLGVTNGLFTATLDFGGVPFSVGANRWLNVAVRPGASAGNYTNVAPRQPITAAPYAITARNVTGTVAASQLSGAVPLANLPTTALVTNGQTGVNLTGTFSGNGAGVTNLNLSLNSGGAMNLSGFVLSSSPHVAGSPSSVTTADINGDGKVDLISVSIFSDTLTVLTNNGSGSFSPSTLGVGSRPLSVTTADVNGDGKVDLICANDDGNTLTVLTNNGSGSFALSSSPGVGNSPRSVTAADVNGDGKVDLISANFNASTLTVLTNNGSGGFVLSSSPAVGSQPRSVTAADVNGDAKVDLISANQNANTLTVLTNNGSGGFALSSSPSVGYGPQSVTAADVNGDGKVDLISANQFADTLTVLINNGSGSFVLSSSPSVGNDPQSVTAADVNGDGKVDLISANSVAGTLTVLINVSFFTGNFAGNFPSGNVGIGTTTPSVPLHIASDPQAVMVLQDTGSASTQSGYIGFWNNSSIETAWVGFGTPGSPDFSIVNARSGGNIILSPVNGKVGIGRVPTANKFEVEGNVSKTAAGSWLANSDARIKTDVRTVTGALDKLAQVRLVEFHYMEDYRAQHPGIEDRRYLNVVAQEFQKVFPEHVQSSGEKLPASEDAILQVDTYPLTIYSAAAIQELNRKLEAGSQRSADKIQKLETENAELQQAMNELKELVQTMNRKLSGGVR